MKKFIIIILLLTIILKGQSNFVDANSVTNMQEGVQKEETLVNELLLTRVELWNKIYDNSYDAKTFEEEIKIIEEDPLLSFDIKYFEEMKSAPTELDKVLNFTLLDIKNISYGRSTMTADVKTLWEMEGQNSFYFEELSYQVKLKNTDEGWKLLDFSPIQ